MKPCTGCGQESHGLYSYSYAGDAPGKSYWLCPMCWRLNESVEQGEREVSRLDRESREIGKHLIRMRHYQRQKKEASMEQVKVVFERLERDLATAVPLVDQLLADAINLQGLLRGHPMSVNELVEDLREAQKVLYVVQRKLQLSRYLPTD